LRRGLLRLLCSVIMGEAEPSYPTVTADWQTRHGRRQRLHCLGNTRSIVPPGQSNASASAISMRTPTYRNECESRWTLIWRPSPLYTCRPRTTLRRGVETFPWRGVRLLCAYEGSGTLRGSGLLGRSGAPAACAWVPVPPGHVVSPDLPRPRNRSGPLSGGQDFGPQGSGCLVVVTDDY